MNPEVEPQKKKKKTNPYLFSSLPNEIIVNCLARVPRSYYPILSLVCKIFRSLILSKDLSIARFHLATYESIFHVCLQYSNCLGPYWFSLWIKPDQNLTNDIGRKKKSTGNTLLVPVPSSYVPSVPMLIVGVGSQYYGLTQYNKPSPVLWVCSKDSIFWHKAPSMTVARKRAFAGVLNEKIYVVGGCGENESANWAEVFDPKTQTWEPLPDPGAEIRFSKIRRIEAIQGKLYLRSNETKDYVYDPKQGKWNVSAKSFLMCLIENVCYGCDKKRCLWLDTKRKEWRVVRGLSTLNKNRRGDFTEIANYGGKLLIMWDKFVHQGRCQYKNIWCASIALKRRNDDEVWGNIEWASVVLTVPSSYAFIRSLRNTF